VFNRTHKSSDTVQLHVTPQRGGTKKMTVTLDDMRVIAYHEAGHAVVAWSLGVLIKELRIGPNGGICKHALTVSPLLDPELMGKGDWMKVEKQALILLAGEVAEQIGGQMAELAGYGELAELCNYAHDASSESIVPGSDREELRELVQLAFGDLGPHAVEWIDRTEAKATDIVMDHWSRVCALSNALLNKNVLCGTEAIQVIELTE